MLLYIVLIILVIIVLLNFIAPNSYAVQRSIMVDKPREDVFEYLKLIKNQDHWSPWAKRDPDMKQEHRGTDGEIGFVSAWDSEHKQVGQGEQELTGLVPHERIDSKLRFFKPFKSESDGFFLLSDQNGSTEVTWGFTGNNKFPINIMMLFMNIEKSVGKDFEQGLVDLKSVLEG